MECVLPFCSETVVFPLAIEKHNVETYSFIHSFSILSDDRSKASSKTIPPHSAEQHPSHRTHSLWYLTPTLQPTTKLGQYTT